MVEGDADLKPSDITIKKDLSNPLYNRLHSLVVKEEKKMMAKQKYYPDRKKLALEIINGHLLFARYNQTFSEHLLDQAYGKKLHSTGKVLYPLMMRVLIQEWDTMGVDHQKVFGPKTAEKIAKLRTQFSQGNK